LVSAVEEQEEERGQLRLTDHRISTMLIANAMSKRWKCKRHCKPASEKVTKQSAL